MPAKVSPVPAPSPEHHSPPASPTSSSIADDQTESSIIHHDAPFDGPSHSPISPPTPPSEPQSPEVVKYVTVPTVGVGETEEEEAHADDSSETSDDGETREKPQSDSSEPEDSESESTEESEEREEPEYIHEPETQAEPLVHTEAVNPEVHEESNFDKTEAPEDSGAHRETSITTSLEPAANDSTAEVHVPTSDQGMRPSDETVRKSSFPLILDADAPPHQASSRPKPLLSAGLSSPSSTTQVSNFHAEG